MGGAVNGPGAAAPAILIEGDGAYIEGLTVTGGATGVMFAGPVLASMTNVVVRNPASGHAVAARGGGDVSLSGCTLMQANRGLQITRGGAVRVAGNTEIRENADSGIFADSNSIVYVSGSKILANGGHGIDLENGSQGTISNSEIADNSIGILVSASQANIGANNNIHNNREHARAGVGRRDGYREQQHDHAQQRERCVRLPRINAGAAGQRDCLQWNRRRLQGGLHPADRGREYP